MDAQGAGVAEQVMDAGSADDGLLAQLRDAGMAWVSARVTAMLRELDDRLFEMAVNAADSLGQNRYFDAMRELRARHDDVLAAWRQEFGQRSLAALRHDTCPPRRTNVTLAFGGPASALTIGAMIHAALIRHEGTLQGLNSLLNGLWGRVWLDGAQGSVAGPELLAACCAGAARSTAMDVAVYAQWLPIFDRDVLANLDELCARCAGVLIDAGVQPLAASVPATPARARPQPQPAAADPAAQDSGNSALITGIFEYIVRNETLAPPLRALLFQFQPLAVAASAADDRLFRDPAHPLRRIINEAARLAIGWEPGDRLQDDVAQLLAAALHRLRAAGGYDDALAGQVLGDIIAFGCRAQQIARLTQRRTEDVEQSRLRRLGASSAIDRFLAAQMDGTALPAAAAALMREGWLRVMNCAYLRGGEQGEDWEEAAMLGRAFVEQCQGGSGGIGETLAEALRDRMMRAGCDPLRIEILLQGVAEDLASHEAPGGTRAARRSPGGAAADGNEQPAADMAAYLCDVDRIGRGAWFRFEAAGGVATRGKLALRVGDPARLLFVDRHGNRLDSLTRERFARLLAAGHATPLTEEDLFDAALAAGLGRRERPGSQAG